MKKSLLLLLVYLCLCMSLILASCSSGGSDPAGSDDTTVNADNGSATTPSDNSSSNGSDTQGSDSDTEEENGEGEHTCSMAEVSRIDATFTAAGSITYKCSCGEERIEPIAKLEHSYSSTLTHNGGDTHWYACTDEGYEDLKKDEATHTLVAGTFRPATYESAEFTEYFCDCGYSKQVQTADMLSHNYASTWSYDTTSHWHACTDAGYTHLKADESLHHLSESNFDSSTGYATYRCDCGYSEQYLRAVITSTPTVSGTAYIGQKLSDIMLTGGSGSVDGSFVWSSPETVITESGSYNVTFVPTSSEYASIPTQVQITATQLTVTVSVGENGSASSEGAINVNYGSSLTVTFTPDSGYAVESVSVGGISVTKCSEYTFSNITSNQTLSVTFAQQATDNTGAGTNTGANESENWTFAITCLSGTPACYTYDEATGVLTFSAVSADSVYSISGTLDGSIVIDTGDDYKFDLEMHGFTLTSASVNPITVLSGSEVSLKAKNGYENFIYDNRAAIDTTDTTLYSAAIYSLVDLELSGKGSLTVVSANNNGIHTKDDLQVKNLALSVTCVDNALKGNDSVEITDATTTLIATGGDCIKTTNSHINETTSNQKGTVYIAGGTHNLFAACDGIDAAYNVVVEDSASSVTVLNIYTDKYSEYTGEVTTTAQGAYYIKASSTSYTYSVMYYNSSDGTSEMVNASTSYETVTTTSTSNRPGSSGTTYYYYTFAKKSGYDKIVVYMYSSSQTQGSTTDYTKCSDYKTINESYDTVVVSSSSSSSNRPGSSSSSSTTLSISWELYSSNGSSYSTKGIKAANEITINGGTITIEAYDDGIHANNDGGTLENGVDPTGNVTITGGTITVSSDDDGIHADGTLTISGGTVNVVTAYEGIEAPNIVFSGGTTTVYSTDDAVNASGDNPLITITGGYIDLATPSGDTDTLDSNGDIKMTGGTLVIKNGQSGTSGMGGTIDCDGSVSITGGTLISCGAINTEVGYISGSVYNTSTKLSAGDYTIKDSSGNVIVEFTLGTSYTAYMFYSDAFVSGTTYYVYCDGSQVLTFTK